jgi:ATP-dependent DNA ligase
MSAGPSRLPKFIAPQVPILSAEPPKGDGWIHEIKHDGFRTLLRIDRSDIRAFTRGETIPSGHYFCLALPRPFPLSRLEPSVTL